MNETMQLSLLRERFCRRERRSVAAAREFVREAATDWGFGARLDDVLVCVSELATNALLHGVPPGRGYLVRLRLEAEGRVLSVEVHDSGGGVPAVRRPDGESGRGLLLVDALADRWGVGDRDPGKIVWCAFTRPHRPIVRSCRSGHQALAVGVDDRLDAVAESQLGEDA